MYSESKEVGHPVVGIFRQKTVHRVSEMVLTSGIYRVCHLAHRADHDLTLLEGEMFPPCHKCGSEVELELIRSAPSFALHDFRVKLYEISHPDDEELSA